MSSVKKAANRERARARKVVRNQIGVDVFLAAQNFKCGICGEDLLEWDLSVDHVYPFSTYPQHHGNLILAHLTCNMRKDSRHPTVFEQQMLGLVNRCLGYRKGVYRAAKPWKGMKFVTNEFTPAEFFFYMLTLIYFKVIV